MANLEQLENIVKKLLDENSNAILNKMYPIEEFPQKISSIVAYILCKKLNVSSKNTERYEQFISCQLDMAKLNKYILEKVEVPSKEEVKEFLHDSLNSSCIDCKECENYPKETLLKYLDENNWDAVVVKCYSPFIIDSLHLANYKTPIYLFDEGDNDRFIEYIFSAYAVISDLNCYIGQYLSEVVITGQILYLIDLSLYMTKITPNYIKLFFLNDFPKTNLGHYLTKFDSECSNVVFFLPNNILEQSFLSIDIEKNDFSAIKDYLVDTPYSSEITEFKNWSMIKRFVSDCQATKNEEFVEHEITFVHKADRVSVKFDNGGFDEDKKSLDEILKDESIYSHYVAEYSLRPSVFLLYANVNESLLDYLKKNYIRGCQSIPKNRRKIEDIDWDDSVLLVNRFESIKMFDKTCILPKDLVLDLYLNPREFSNEICFQNLYLLEKYVGMFSTTEKYVLKMIFTKVGSFARESAVEINVFLQPSFNLFILQHISVPKCMFSENIIEVLATGIRVEQEANIKIPLFNDEDVKQLAYYDSMMKIFNTFVDYKILKANEDNTYFWHNSIKINKDSIGEYALNTLRHNPFIKGMFYFLCSCSCHTKETIKVKPQKEGISYDNKTGVRAYLPIFFQNLSKENIKNSEDSFKKKIKKYTKENIKLLKKDDKVKNYYDIVFMYIRTELIKYKDKNKKRRIEFNDKESQTANKFMNELEKLSANLVSLDLNLNNIIRE